MNTIFNIGNQHMQMNLGEMQQVFALISNSKKCDLFAIQSGLNVIQDIGDFLARASQHSAIGYLIQEGSINTKIKCMKECFAHVMFIRSKGKIDLLAKNILNPEETRDISAITSRLGFNLLGKEVLIHFEKELITPISETLDEIEMMILAKTLQGVEVIDEEERKLYAATEEEFIPTQFEADNCEGSYVPGFGTHLNLKNSLIKEAQTMRKPKDMEQEDYQKLKNLWKEISQQRDILKRVNAVAKIFQGLGFTIVEES